MSKQLIGVPFMVSEREFGAMQKHIENIDATTAKLSSAVYGNGREGLVETTTRIEERLTAHTAQHEALDCRMDNLESLVKSINDKLEANKPLTFKDMVWDNKGLIGKVIVGIVVLSAIIHMIMPPTLTIWDLIAFLAGA